MSGSEQHVGGGCRGTKQDEVQAGNSDFLSESGRKETSGMMRSVGRN